MTIKRKEITKLYLLIYDIICIIISFNLAAWVRFGFDHYHFFGTIYGLAFILLVLSYISIFYFFDNFYNFFKRGFMDEFYIVFKGNVLLALFITGILFIYQRGAMYSRAFFACFFFLNVCIDYVARQFFKIILLSYYKRSNSSNKVIVITTLDQAYTLIDVVNNQLIWEYQITGVIILDKDMSNETINGVHSTSVYCQLLS